MTYTAHDLAEIYNFSVRYFQKKLKAYMAICSRTNANECEPKLFKKGRSIALESKDLKGFLAFCGLDESKIKNYSLRTNANDRERFANKSEQINIKSLLSEKDKRIKEYQKQIEYFRNLIESEKDEKENLIDTFKEESFRKDIILRESINNINIYKELNTNIVKSIEYNKQVIIDITDSSKKKISIIEDEEDIAELLKMNLEQAGYEAMCFVDVQEASKYYLKNFFDLTLLDLNLNNHAKNNISGEKFWNIIKKFGVDTPVIIVSGESDDRLREAEQVIKPIKIFKKPLDYNELTKCIEDTLNAEII